MNKLDFGSLIAKDTGMEAKIVLEYPKKDRISDLIVGGAFITIGILLPIVFRNSYFKGAYDYYKLENKALHDIGAM